MAAPPSDATPKKTAAQKVPRGAAWGPPNYELADAVAINAVAKGEATPDQQVRAMKWIIEQGCQTYGLSYRPDGMGGDRDTAFAEGRRFVGTELRKFINNLEAIRLHFSQQRKDKSE